MWCQKERSLEPLEIVSWAASPKQVTCSHRNSNILFVFWFKKALLPAQFLQDLDDRDE
jgi:hypothetical protein